MRTTPESGNLMHMMNDALEETDFALTGLVFRLLWYGTWLLIAAAMLIMTASAALRSTQLALVILEPDRNRSTLQLIDIDRMQTVNLLQTAGLSDDPTWSPDGVTIYLGVYRPDRSGRDIAAYDLRTQQFRWLTDGPMDNNTPHAAPSGDRLVYQGFDGGTTQWNIYLLDLANGRSRQFFESEAVDGRPAWSPDGREIAFETGADGQSPRIAVRNVANRTTRYLTPGFSIAPAWSPDGSHIAYVGYAETIFSIFVIDVSGGDPQLLTYHPGGNSDPAWSPDGGLIAFTSRRTADGYRHIFVIHPDGSGLRQLTTEPVNHGYAAWRPLSADSSR